MSTRTIIDIDEKLCTGCALCIPNCPEGALQIIDGKARLVSDLFCDGLGACIGTCPVDAITIEEREAEPYDERRVMENIARQGANTLVVEYLSGLGGVAEPRAIEIAASTSAGDSSSLAPISRMIWFSPAAFKVIKPTPVGRDALRRR